jgi:FkbM family methyltransferase
MSTLGTLRWILSHPLNRGHRSEAIRRYLAWQFGSRLVPGPVAVPFAGTTRLLVERGMAGATGNIYCGLHEFRDMAFVLHLLRPMDLFIDVGANVGSYTVLAAGVAGCQCISIEPHPRTFRHLEDNVRLNGLGERVVAHNVALGPSRSRLSLTADMGAMNHIIDPADDKLAVVEVEVQPLDALVAHVDAPVAIKIDVEGFELKVIAGATQVLRSPRLMAVVMEVNGSGVRYGSSDGQLHQQMLNLGFLPYEYDPMARALSELDSAYLSGGNVIYLRDRAQASERLTSASPFAVLGRTI